MEFISRPDGSSEVKRYINGNIIEKKVTQAGSNTSTASIQILLKDHLGSLHTIVDAGNMTVVQRMSFDPFGLRRSPTDWKAVLSQSQVNSLYGINNATTTRGFTGHEQLDEVGLIHMNGRVYDPKLGRFLQADPFVQYENFTQNYNRYTYLLNNPLNATDPTGYFVFTLAAMIYVAAAETVKWYVAAAIFGAAGFADALIQGASFGDALRAGIIAGVSAAAFSGIGTYLGQSASFTGNFAAGLSKAGFAMKVGLHAITGGVMSVLQGGKFGHGFAAAGFTALGSSFNNSQFIGGKGFSSTRVVIGAVIGGTASKISGGKFANGAVTGAFSQALNNEMSEKRDLESQQAAEKAKQAAQKAKVRPRAKPGKAKTLAELLGVDYSYGTYAGGSAVSPAGGMNFGVNGQFFSDGSSDAYGVAGVGWGLDLGGASEVNVAVYLGEGNAGVTSWIGRFDSVHISGFGFTVSGFTDGSWFGLSGGVSSDGFAISYQINEYHSLTGNK